MKLQDTTDDHFERVLPKSAIVVVASVIAYAFLLFWMLNSVPDFDLFIFEALAALIVSISAFIAGNTYRLRDVRRRNAYRLSQLDSTTSDADRRTSWSQMVPPTTIRFRFRIAITGVIFGVLAQAAIVLIFVQLDEIVTGLVATLLVIVLGGLVFLAGTYSRPVD